jgi:DNA topoisomerase-1
MSAKDLVIIESPNKIETLKKYLGNNYEIIATVGHIRDLPKSTLGFDQQTLEPMWTIPRRNPKQKNQKSKKEIIQQINSAASKAKNIYLASDPDREGEAISWHVYNILEEKYRKKAKRIVFNEISENAVKEAIKNPREIDDNWVHSQFSRRILDRMIGYKLSQVVKKAVHADSAGRVQSVALRFIEEREEEIEKFKPSFWWTVDITLHGSIPLILKDINPTLNINPYMDKEDGGSSGVDFSNPEDAQKLVKSLQQDYKLYSIDNPEFYVRNPREPYKTSTLQQDAVNKLGWQSKKIMSVAQKLYEGFGSGNDHQAYISYPRTDSTRLSSRFTTETKDFIESNYGSTYVNEQFRNYKKADENVQDAHEAIRPININFTPEKAKDSLSKDEYSLYKLIWIRTVASLMSSAKFKKQILRFENSGNKFYAFSRELLFDGFRKVYSSYKEEDQEKLIDVEKVKAQRSLKSEEVKITDHQTKPPARYTQASLIAELEKSGVGRPSTYSTMANINIDRGYAKLVNRAFVPTEHGREVVKVLEKDFGDVINKDFTKEMEVKLDRIAEGQENWKNILIDFWPKFNERVQKVVDETKETIEYLNEKCPKCGKELIYRYSHKGQKFIGCSGFPSCTYLRSLNPPKKLEETCPLCKSHLIERTNKRGQKFVGCSNYPKCRFIANYDKDMKIIWPEIDKVTNEVVKTKRAKTAKKQ